MQLLNQEMLIQRHSDVATVWLLSTLGVKSTYKKVTKKQIQDISIPQTVTVITEPDNLNNIHILRVSSNLLYGVAIVYKQKLNYLENDTVNMKTKLSRDLLRVLNPNCNNNLIQVPRDIIINETPDYNRSRIKETRSMFLQEDPLFNINDGLLPPSDFLTQQPIDPNSNKERIKKLDLMDNIFASFTNNNGEDGIFAKNNLIEDDEDQLNEVEFAFDEDGFLLDLPTKSCSTDTLKKLLLLSSSSGTSAPRMEDDFDFTFGGNDEDLARGYFSEVPITPLKESTPLDSERGKGSTPLSLNNIQEEESTDNHGNVFQDNDNEMGQIFDEVPPIHNDDKDIEKLSKAKKKKKKSNVRNKRSVLTMIKMDEERVSLTTDQLREFRDNYIEDQISKRPVKKRNLGFELQGYIKQQSFLIPRLEFQSNPKSQLPNGIRDIPLGLEPQDDNDHLMVQDIERDGSYDNNDANHILKDYAPAHDDENMDFIDELMLSNDVTEIEVARRSSRRHSSRSSIGSIYNNAKEDSHVEENFNFSTEGYQDFNYSEVFEIADEDTFNGATDGSSSSRTRKNLSQGSTGVPICKVIENEEEFDFPSIQTSKQFKSGLNDTEIILVNSKAEKFYNFLVSKVPEDKDSIVFGDIFNGIYHKETIVKSFYEVLQLNNLNKLKIRILNNLDMNTDRFKVLTKKDFEILI